MFAAASVRSRKIESGNSGSCARLSIVAKATSSAADPARSAIVLVAFPAVLRRAGDRVDQQHQPARAGDRPERVKPPAHGGGPAVGDESRCERQRGCADRDVQVEDVLPPGVAGEKPAADQPDGRAGGSEPAPDPKRLVALGALLEHVHHDRHGGGHHASPRRVPERPGSRSGMLRSVASPQASDAAVNTASPSIRIRRRPSRSAARPPSRRKPPNVIAYAVTTHCRLVSLKCRSRPIVGSETLTIVSVDDRHEVRDRQQRERAPAIDIRRCGRHWASRRGLVRKSASR